MKKRRSFEFSKILMIALIISFSFLIAGIVGININKDLGNINSVVNSGNIVDPDDTDGSYETLNYSQKDIGKTVETVGSGTEEDPYIISNIDQFLYLTGTGRYGTMKGIYEERELAEGYTQIDFLQSNVWAYIDTEYYPNANTKIEYILNNPTSDNFSTGASTNNVKFMSSLNSSYGTGFACNSTTQIYQVPTKGWHKFTMCGNGNYYVDDSLVLQTGSFMEQIENSVYIYALNYDDTIYTGSGRGYGQLYSYKIYEGETLVKDFVPCETSEGLVGLYDVVEGKFHENKGTNDFIKGSRWVAHSKNYLENAYIELGNDLCFNDGYFDEDGVYYDGGDGELWTWNKNGPWGGLNFKGVFDGKGNEIQGLYGIAPDWSAFASYLFYSLNGATIKNIVFNNVNLGFYSHYCGATVCSKATDSLIENVKIYGRLTNPVAAGLSGVVYEAINTTFNCCENFATIICKSGQPSAAGFVARATSCKFFNCKNYGDIEGAYAASCYTSYATDCYFENCENHGDLNGGK